MNDEHVREVRKWAQRLATDDRPEIRAAAKAIIMLADDLSALRAQRRLDGEVLTETADATPIALAAEKTTSDVASSLRTRLRSFHVPWPS